MWGSSNSPMFRQSQSQAPPSCSTVLHPELAIVISDGGNLATNKTNAVQNECNMEMVLGQTKRLEEDLQKLGYKIKHHEEKIEHLKIQSYNLDNSIKDIKGNLRSHRSSKKAEALCHNGENKQAEQETVDQILLQDKRAAGLLCRIKGLQTADCLLFKDVLGIVATLGKAPDDNLSRLFSEYLGLEKMLAIVCKTYEGIKALEKYDGEGKIDLRSGLHGLGTSIRRPISGRFLAICLEDLRPYVGKHVKEDPQKRLDLLKPRLPTGEYPPGFLGFAVNMITVDVMHLKYVTSSGHGLRETLFYALFSRLQVYRTRADMELAIPYISDGALSLDGGMIKSCGVFKLGRREDIDVRFPVSLNASSTTLSILESEEQLKQLIWNRERIDEDIGREKFVLDNVRTMYNKKRGELVNFLAQSAPLADKALLGQERNGIR
ncbi:protein DEFECTIVE IN MERISTEM SILENCING 3-like isoform X2 [Nymphaea colorata]|nr:protein DEFECTIVE IN MERISTEM SILENCING 3-like isoform X2 [Nymphaea colorata]